MNSGNVQGEMCLGHPKDHWEEVKDMKITKLMTHLKMYIN